MGVGLEDALDSGTRRRTRAVDANVVRNYGWLDPGLKILNVQHIREHQIQRGRRMRNTVLEHGPRTALRRPHAVIPEEFQHTRRQIVEHIRATIRLWTTAHQQILRIAQGTS